MPKDLIDRYICIGLVGMVITFWYNMELFSSPAVWKNLGMTLFETGGTILNTYIISFLVIRIPFIALRAPLLFMLSTVCSLISNTFFIFLFEYLVTPKPHTPIWERDERYPVTLIVSAVTMLPLVIAVSYSTIKFIRSLRLREAL